VCVSDLSSVVPTGVYKKSINLISNQHPFYKSRTPNRDSINSSYISNFRFRFF
jgi:hypothetical protein